MDLFFFVTTFFLYFCQWQILHLNNVMWPIQLREHRARGCFSGSQRNVFRCGISGLVVCNFGWLSATLVGCSGTTVSVAPLYFLDT